jgi:hypothetical protein
VVGRTAGGHGTTVEVERQKSDLSDVSSVHTVL